MEEVLADLIPVLLGDDLTEKKKNTTTSAPVFTNELNRRDTLILGSDAYHGDNRRAGRPPSARDDGGERSRNPKP